MYWLVQGVTLLLSYVEPTCKTSFLKVYSPFCMPVVLGTPPPKKKGKHTVASTGCRLCFSITRVNPKVEFAWMRDSYKHKTKIK